MDFADELERIEKESERTHGYVKEKDIRGLVFGNFDKYADENRFEMVGDDEDMEAQIITVGGKNVKKNVVIGHTIHYKCKPRGHGCSIGLTMEEYDERFGGKELKKEEVKK